MEFMFVLKPDNSANGKDHAAETIFIDLGLCKSSIKVNSPMARLPRLDEHRLLGTSGLRVSPMCLGTMTFGENWGMGAPRDVSRQVFMDYVQSGGNFIDTANNYQDGTSEKWLGEFMAELGCRDDLVVATKYSLPVTGTRADGKAVYNINHCGNHRKSLFRSVEESLQRLQTHYIDIMYVHYWDWTTQPEEMMRALDDLVRIGKIHYVAASDMPCWAVAECNMLAQFRGWSPFIGLQYQYSLVERSIERDITQYAEQRRLGLVPWGILGGGKLSGKYRRGVAVSQVDTTRNAWFSQVADREYDIAEAVAAVAQEVGRTSSQVAINWVMQQKSVCSALIGARTPAQLRDNLGALEFKLTPEQLRKLSDASFVDEGWLVQWLGKSRFDSQWLEQGGKFAEE